MTDIINYYFSVHGPSPCKRETMAPAEEPSLGAMFYTTSPNPQYRTN